LPHKGEAQSSEIDSPLAFVGYSKETKQSPNGKTSDGDHCDAEYFSRGRMRILHENESDRESQSGKIEFEKRASLFLANCAGLGMHCYAPPQALRSDKGPSQDW